MSRNHERSGGSRLLDVVLTLALLGGLGGGAWYVYSKGVMIDQTTTYYVAEAQEQEPTEDPNAPKYDSVEVPNTAVNQGPLILVNNDIPCVTDEENLVSLYERMLEAGSESFGVRDGELQVDAEYADAIIAMLDDFYRDTGDDSILVLSGYRTQELQQQLYDEDLEETGLDYSDRVSKPGYSEHQTGYSIDLSISDGEYDGTGIYSWIDEHCAEYGIILRYPDAKQDITNIRYEPWHYRYVGKPHAAYITQNHLCLEEYINLIETTYPYEGEHLVIADTDGKLYEVYYYAKDQEYDSTMVAVPAGRAYTICGTNSNGFIVTVEADPSAVPSTPVVETVPETTAPAEETQEVPSEDEEQAEDAELGE